MAEHIPRHKTITHIAYFKTRRTVVENTGKIKRHMLDKLVIYVIYACCNTFAHRLLPLPFVQMQNRCVN